MEIKRVNVYNDSRFSPEVLLQHGCFLADNVPYEVEIISEFEAIVRGEDPGMYLRIIEEFRFYTPHITKFYHGNRQILREYPRAQVFTVSLDQIQPSQFFVDEEKVAAVSKFIRQPNDIIVQVLPFEGRYISLDGHTRLYYAVMNGWKSVRGVVETSDDWVYGFVEEARRRNIHSPKDLMLVDHQQYEEKWNGFCDDYFAKRM